MQPSTSLFKLPSFKLQTPARNLGAQAVARAADTTAAQAAMAVNLAAEAAATPPAPRIAEGADDMAAAQDAFGKGLARVLARGTAKDTIEY